jgi:hypothetical protein
MAYRYYRNSEEDFLIWQNAQTVHTPEFPMKQMTFADAEYAGKRKQTRKELFLIEMDRVVPWKGLIALIEPHYPKGEGGRPAYPLMAMLRVQWLEGKHWRKDPANRVVYNRREIEAWMGGQL